MTNESFDKQYFTFPSRTISFPFKFYHTSTVLQAQAGALAPAAVPAGALVPAGRP